jgi:hypothetical protein
MFKTYLKPELEVKAFETEDIVLASALDKDGANIDVGGTLL